MFFKWPPSRTISTNENREFEINDSYNVKFSLIWILRKCYNIFFNKFQFFLVMVIILLQFFYYYFQFEFFSPSFQNKSYKVRVRAHSAQCEVNGPSFNSGHFVGISYDTFLFSAWVYFSFKRDVEEYVQNRIIFILV